MDNISTPYGSKVTLTFTTDDTAIETVSIVVGKPGALPEFTHDAPVTGGIADLTVSGELNEIPLDTYNYQLVTLDSDGEQTIYPNRPQCNDCDDSDLPTYTVTEALNATETS